jgi:hypothetical protein
MQFVMTPPVQEEFTNNDVKIDRVRVLDRDRDRCASGLGQLPSVSAPSGAWGNNEWMPVVIIVISAMALMFVYAVLHDRKR